MTGAPAQPPGKAERSRGAPGIGASGIHRGTKPVLQCLKFGRKALRRYGRTATEARVRMIMIHLLYHCAILRCATDRNRTGAFRFNPDALHELQLRLHSAEHETAKPARASRDLREPEPMA